MTIDEDEEELKEEALLNGMHILTSRQTRPERTDPVKN